MILHDRPFRGGRAATYMVATGMVVLIGVLAALQYRWLGQISDAERERLKTTLGTQALEFAEDVDREITRAYLLFQVDPGQGTNVGASLADRYDRWTVTSRFPKLIKEIYFVRDAAAEQVERLDMSSRTLVTVQWPSPLAALRRGAVSNVDKDGPRGTRTVVVHTVMAPVVESIPALVVPTPVVVMSPEPGRPATLPDHLPASAVYILLDREYMTRDLLPGLVRQHFTAGGLGYRVAVLHATGQLIYTSEPSFTPPRDTTGDASAEFLQVRAQDFGSIASEVRRFVTFTATRATDEQTLRDTVTTATATATIAQRLGPNVSIVLQQGASRLGAGAAPLLRGVAVLNRGWKLVVEHPSGSLEHSVAMARRRNLAISMGILGVLGLSLGFLVTSTRRAQALARQQMDFVATVSHELRTPLAVIRAAADNLADGVIGDGARIRQYGELVRTEGRRLSRLVEQILEFAGLQSGQRALASAPVAIAALLREVAATSDAVAAPARVRLELDVPDGLPAVAGDEAALRRVFQNLVDNAIKYGAAGGWVGIAARANGNDVEVTITDRGIGIDASDQARIFEPFYRAPDVVQEQIQGAGLGLSLVARIVAAHGGSLKVESARGSGSAFTVVLPVAAA